MLKSERIIAFSLQNSVVVVGNSVISSVLVASVVLNSIVDDSLIISVLGWVVRLLVCSDVGSAVDSTVIVPVLRESDVAVSVGAVVWVSAMTLESAVPVV